MMKITNELLDHVQTFLGQEGLDFFKTCLKEHGDVSPCLSYGPVPHPVHLREGMQVRNSMRMSGQCDDWDAHDFDGLWKQVVEKIIDRTEIVEVWKDFHKSIDS